MATPLLTTAQRKDASHITDNELTALYDQLEAAEDRVRELEAVHKLALSVRCPKCHVYPGTPCRNMSRPHHERVEATGRAVALSATA